jgi:hypothetical protein
VASIVVTRLQPGAFVGDVCSMMARLVLATGASSDTPFFMVKPKSSRLNGASPQVLTAGFYPETANTPISRTLGMPGLSLLDGAPEVYMVDVMTGTARQAG